jgi:PAS domain S-box-containing protein
MKSNNSDGKNAEQLYRMQVRQLKDYAIFFIGVDGRIATWNKGVGHLLGYTEEEWIGLDTSVIFAPCRKSRWTDLGRIDTRRRIDFPFHSAARPSG